MRILHLLDHSLPHRTGYALRAGALLRAQRAWGWHTIALTGPAHGAPPPAEGLGPDAELEDDEDECAGHIYRSAPPDAPAPACAFLQRRRAHAALARRLRQLVRLARPDLLHVHPPLAHAPAALAVGHRCGLPVLYEAGPWRADQPLSGTLGPDERRVARRLDGLIVPTRAALARWRDAWHGRGAAVVPPALDLPTVAGGASARAGLPLPGAWPVLACAGALDTDAGMATLVQALAVVVPAHPGTHLLIHGSGAGVLAARLEASRLALPVHALAGAPGQDLPALYARADLVVFARLPSVAADLEVPFRLLEAMAHGCAVLASDVAGHRELVHHRDTGMLFQAGRADALATALLRLLAEPSRLGELGRAARAFVATQRSWDCAMASYAPVYERLCARAP